MDQPQDRPTVRPNPDAYAGVTITESRLAALVTFLRARPSSDLALVGVFSCLLYVGGTLARSGYVWGAGGISGMALLTYLLAAHREDRHRADQARSPQLGDQPGG